MSYVMVGMAAAGLLKSQTIDKDKEKRDRKLAAETQRLSPWTGLQAGPVKEADPMGSAIAFGATGAQIGGGMQQQEMNKKLAEQALARGATPQVNLQQPVYMQQNPWGGMGNYGG